MALEASAEVEYTTVAFPRLICCPSRLKPYFRLQLWTLPYLLHISRSYSVVNYSNKELIKLQKNALNLKIRSTQLVKYQTD